MIGIPLMFMCLTYTGDLLADAFISGYSKMVNCTYRLVCGSRLKNCLPEQARRSFEQTDVKKKRQILLSFIIHLFDLVRSRRLTSRADRSYISCTCFVYSHGCIIICSMGKLACT